MPGTGIIKRIVRIAFHRKSRSPPPSSGRQFDLSGKCLVCGGIPDPLKPGICFCPLRARARAVTRTRERDS